LTPDTRDGHALYEDGPSITVDHPRLQKHHIGEDDLLEELRLNGAEDPHDVKLARLERSGEISVIKS
jgi:uncharacterized membrane protein YcaP (DUF421 family)